MTRFKQTVQELNQQKDTLNKTITALTADLHTQQMSSCAFVDTMPRASLTGFLFSTFIER